MIVSASDDGQQDGTVDSQFTPAFMVGVTWSLLTAAHYDVRHGKQSRRQIADMCHSALAKVARAPEARP